MTVFIQIHVFSAFRSNGKYFFCRALHQCEPSYCWDVLTKEEKSNSRTNRRIATASIEFEKKNSNCGKTASIFHPFRSILSISIYLLFMSLTAAFGTIAKNYSVCLCIFKINISPSLFLALFLSYQ